MLTTHVEVDVTNRIGRLIVLSGGGGDLPLYKSCLYFAARVITGRMVYIFIENIYSSLWGCNWGRDVTETNTQFDCDRRRREIYYKMNTDAEDCLVKQDTSILREVS